MSTLTKSGKAKSPTEPRHLHVQIDKDAYLRLHHHARVKGQPTGRFLSALLKEHLPAVEVAA